MITSKQHHRAAYRCHREYGISENLASPSKGVYCICSVRIHRSASFGTFASSHHREFLLLETVNKVLSHPFLVKTQLLYVITVKHMEGKRNAEKSTVCTSLLLLSWNPRHHHSITCMTADLASIDSCMLTAPPEKREA